MAGGPTIDVTNFIDERRFSWFQGRVLALCILLQICDGIDLQAIGYTGARIRAELHPTLGEMGWVFSAGLIGMACGALIFGPVADKIGRRTVMIISVFLFGAFSFAIAFVGNVWELMALRFCAGLGFGGALPNSLGLVAEYVPKRSRYTIMGLSSLGFIGGGAASGWIAIALMPAYGWRSVFMAGGAAAVVMGVILIAWLPESLRFLAGQPGRSAGVRAILNKIDPRFQAPPDAQFTVVDEQRRGLPVRHLFTEGRAVLTLPFWFAAFFVLLNLYLLVNWIPILTKDLGVPEEQAVFIASLFQVGAGFAGVTIGFLMDRISPFRILGGFAIGGALAVISLGLIGPHALLLMITTFVSGFFIVGCQSCLNLSTATMYPTYVRITGAGWMLGIGRIGSILGPLIGSAILSMALPAGSLFYFAAIPMLCVLGAAVFLAFNAGGFVLKREPRLMTPMTGEPVSSAR
jgi:MFS transporter, AAHS family, 4-hydroxybenzoate transporter